MASNAPDEYEMPVVKAVANDPTEAVPLQAVTPTTPGMGRQVSVISQAEATIALSWDKLRYTVKTPGGPRELLKGLRGTARPGRTLVIMGPSGAGKSTLLNALSGRLLVERTSSLDGYVCLNDVVFSSAYKRVMSFVAQDDIIMPKETPLDAFHFALNMKQSTRTPEEQDELVDGMIEKLRLKDCKNTIMGVPGVIKGVSGGEKKRTNIGTELITNPPIMMLDEPTSGLDSVSALRIGHLLRDLAREEGRTVVCTLHTPSSELFRVFDDILLMAKGHAIYHGPIEGAKVFFASIGMPVPPRVNPSEYYMRLLQSPEDVLDKMAAAWVAYSGAQEAANTNPSINGPPATIHLKNEMLDKLVADRASSSMGKQLMALSGRSWRNTMRDPMLTVVRVFQTLFFGLLLGLLYINLGTDDASVQDRNGLLNTFAMQTCFMSLFPALLTFPAERPVFIQDMTNNLYSAHMYYWSKVVVEFPIHMIIPAMHAIIVYFMAHLARNAEAFFIFLLITLVLGYTGQAVGMMLSAVFENAQTSLALGPLIMMPIMLVAGLLANTDRMEPGWIWLEYMSFMRYAFKGYVLNEYSHLPVMDGPRYKTGYDAVRILGFTKHTDRWQVDVGVMVAIMAFLRIMGSIALWYHGTKNNAALPYPGNFQKLSKSGNAPAFAITASPSRRSKKTAKK